MWAFSGDDNGCMSIQLNYYLIVYLDTRYMPLECIKILTDNFTKRI